MGLETGEVGEPNFLPPRIRPWGNISGPARCVLSPCVRGGAAGGRREWAQEEGRRNSEGKVSVKYDLSVAVGLGTLSGGSPWWINIKGHGAKAWVRTGPQESASDQQRKTETAVTEPVRSAGVEMLKTGWENKNSTDRGIAVIGSRTLFLFSPFTDPEPSASGAGAE